MCPACMATTAMLIASAVSSGGAAALVVNKLRVKRMARRMLREPKPKEQRWLRQTSKTS